MGPFMGATSDVRLSENTPGVVTRRLSTSMSVQCVSLVTPRFGCRCSDFTDRHAQIVPRVVCERSVGIT